MSGAVALVGEWVELDGALAQGARFTVPHAAALKADRMHKIGDQDRGNGHPPCRCWRCRGGIALAERPVLDRILARHLTRITPQESATFLSGWLANPRHGQEARTQLNAWLRIASGSSEPEPTYREFA